MATNGNLNFANVNKVTFEGVGGASNAVIDTTTGKIGVGVDSPDANLHVLGNCFVSTNLELGGTLVMGTVNVEAQHALSAITATGNTTPHTVEFQNATTGLVTTGNVSVGKDLTVTGNVAVDTDALFVDTVNSRVGVGTTNPRTNLHIGQQLSASNGNTIPSAGLGISANFPSSTHAWFSHRTVTTGDEYWGLAVGTIYDGASYLQNLDKSSVTYYNLLLQPNGGNVGIGTTTPTAKLHIKSSSGVDGIAIVNPAGGTGGLLNSSAGVRGGILISNSGGGSDAADNYSSQPIVFSGGGTGATNGNIRGGSIWSIWGGSQYGLAFKGASDGDSVPAGATTPNMFISSDKIGIGTTSPGQLLTLGGQVNPILRLQTTKAGDAWGTSSSDQYGKLQWYGYDYEMNQGSGAEMAGITVGTTSQYPGAMQMRFFVGAPTFSGGNWNLSYVGYLGTSSVSDIDFTGQHRNFIDGIPATEYTDFEGLIVSANKNKYYDVDKNVTTGVNAIQISQSLPLVSLSTKEKDKACFGVISGSEDPDTREYSQGSYVSVCEKQDGDRRAFINSVGEGAIWVTNINGPLESGDYITTSNVAGYGQKQDSDSLKNYTVAKITMDCDFDPVTQPVQIIRKELSNVNYWVKTTYENVTEEEYSNLADENRQIVDGIYQEITKEESKTEQEGYELEVRQELVNVLDEHGQLQWEDHATETEKAYKIRYLDADGNITDEANAVHTAAFVGCTYHCG